MTDYNNGKIHGWNGGECPVHPETVVRYWMRSGSTSDETTACALRWSHNEMDGDIIAFQMVKAYVEPKVIWVNEYADGCHAAFESKQAAGNANRTNTTRTAVKYVEVQE